MVWQWSPLLINDYLRLSGVIIIISLTLPVPCFVQHKTPQAQHALPSQNVAQLIVKCNNRCYLQCQRKGYRYSSQEYVEGLQNFSCKLMFVKHQFIRQMVSLCARISDLHIDLFKI